MTVDIDPAFFNTLHFGVILPVSDWLLHIIQ